MRDILEVIKNIDDLYENNTNMAILKDMERVFDELDLYVYENWEDGELASGPFVDRHWITASFMWPKNKMPNPIAAKRLTELGCKVKYEKTHLIEVRKVKKPSDLRPGTKKGKLDHKPIWIVEIQMPKKIAFDIYRGYMDRMKTEMAGSSKAPQSGTPVPGGPAPTAGMPAPAPAPAGAPMAGGGAPTAGAPAAAGATV
jgi:hypothetical protein